MRDRRIGAGGHDRLERHRISTVVEHQRFQLTADLTFGPARSQAAALHQVGQGRVGGLTCQPQQRQLAGVFDLAQRLHGSRGTHQFDARAVQLFGHRVHTVDRHHVALEAEPAHSLVGAATCQMASACSFDDDFDPGRLLSGLRAIPAVGGQHRLPIVGEHQQRAVGPGESGQVADVDQVCDQHRVQLFGNDLGSEVVSTLRMCHDP
jgi:hypothetical protein